MMTFTFIATFFTLLLAVSAVPVENIPHNDHFSDTYQCVPKEQFIDQCNLCSCTPEGKGATCTMKACPVPERPRIDGYKDGFACAPGKIFYNGCKSCTCAESGNAAECKMVKDCEYGITRGKSVEDNAVPFKQPSYPHIDNFHETGECDPEKMFYHECNFCHCFIGGKGAGCTLMACPGYEELRIDNYVDGQKCPANKTFQNKCNSCKCSTDGLSATCTKMECPGLE